MLSSKQAWRTIAVLHDNPQFLVRRLADVERDEISRAMILCGGDVDLASTRLGISRATLYKKLAKMAKAE
jgi:transcriptional regulator of acetoin/glycerol metabolism